MRGTALLLASTALAVLLASGVVWADTFTVTNEKDSGQGSLRAAITSANAQPGKDVITFASGVRGTINLKSKLPVLRGEVAIKGPGAGRLTVRRAVAKQFTIFTVAEGASAYISGLKVTNGFNTLGGAAGGISNFGDRLTIVNSVISGNKATHAGGGISSISGDLTIRNSIFSDNSAFKGGGLDITGPKYGGPTVMIEDSTFVGNAVSGRGAAGGGMHNLNGRVTIRNSTFSGNTSAGDGGGYFGNKGKLALANSTFSGNTAGSEGGGIFNGGGGSTVTNSSFFRNGAVRGGGIYNETLNLSVLASTFAFNTATGSGGGVYNAVSAAAFSLRATIVANNDAPTGPNASGTFSSGGYNLIGDTAGASGFGPTDLQNVDAGLDPQGLQDNGGPTKTVALVSSSSAIDTVPRTGCPPPATDQRGISRPQDGDGDTVARCDIGAYERRAP